MQAPIEIPNFELLQEIGRGGMARVYLGNQLQPKRKIAVKIVAPMVGQDETFIQTLKQEGDTAALLNHPNVVTIYACGVVDEYGAARPVAASLPGPGHENFGWLSMSCASTSSCDTVDYGITTSVVDLIFKDGFEVGDEVRVEFSLRGREWKSPQGELKYFNSLDVWALERSGGAADDGAAGGRGDRVSRRAFIHCAAWVLLPRASGHRVD